MAAFFLTNLLLAKKFLSPVRGFKGLTTAVASVVVSSIVLDRPEIAQLPGKFSTFTGKQIESLVMNLDCLFISKIKPHKFTLR